MQAVYEGVLLGPAPEEEGRPEMLSCDMASARISAVPTGCSGVGSSVGPSWSEGTRLCTPVLIGPWMRA